MARFHFCMKWSPVLPSAWSGSTSTSSLKCCKHLPPLCPKFGRQMLNTLQLLSTVHVYSFWKVPGGDMTALVFELSSCIGLNWIILLTSPMDSQVIGRELIIPSTSTNNVRRDSSLRLSPFTISEHSWKDASCRSNLSFPYSSHVTCHWKITFPT